MKQDCRLHAEPSDGAAGDGLGDKCNCFHVGWWLVVGVRQCRRTLHRMLQSIPC
jgi:hypothetical protein